MISEAAKHSEYLRQAFPANLHSMARRSLVCGVGVNDADYVVCPSGQIVCGAYSQWTGMLFLCYSSKTPTHIGCSVDPRWHSFMAFRAWRMENHRDGLEINKDLLIPGNKVYGPDSCVFVPMKINRFLCDCGPRRGALPVGVCFGKEIGRYAAKCNNGGKLLLVGTFNTPQEAHLAWRKAKLDRLESLRDQMDAIDPRIYVNAKAKILSYAERLDL